MPLLSESLARATFVNGSPRRETCDCNERARCLDLRYDVMYVADAVGGRSQVAHSIAIARLAHAGAVPATALAVLTELFRDWRAPVSKNALEVIQWEFTESPEV